MKMLLDGRAFWFLSAASIPSGYTADTLFNGKFLQGAKRRTNPTVTTSNTTHDHIDNHNHTFPQHQHPMTISGGATGTTFTSNGLVQTIPNGHTHVSSDSKFAMITTTKSTFNTLAVSDSRPLYTEAIVLKPIDGDQDLPDDIVLFSDNTSGPPTGWSLTDGNGTTPNLTNRFIFGASEGGGTGGSEDHNHGGTMAHSNHVLNAHDHPDSLFGKSTLTPLSVAGGKNKTTSTGAHHEATNISSVTPSVGSSSPAINTVSNTPESIDLLGIQNTSGGDKVLEKGMIFLFVGDVSDIPNADGFELYTPASGKQVRVTVLTANIGNTQGKNIHQMQVSGHFHILGAHTHTFTVSDVGTQVASTSSFIGSTGILQTHAHTSFTMANTVVTSNTSSASTTDDADIRWAFKEVLWVKFNDSPTTVSVSGGNILGGKIAA